MKHDDRIQAALDGELTPSDAHRLQLECVSSPEAKLQMDELKQVDSALRGLKQHEAPQNLRDQVMRQVRLRHAVHLAQVGARGGVFQEWWQAWFGGRPAFQVGLGFALGVLLLVPLTGSAWRQFVDPGSVSGTLAGRVRQAVREDYQISPDSNRGEYILPNSFFP